MAKTFDVTRDDAIMLLQSPECGNGSLDDRTNDQLADMLDNFLQEEDTDENMEFEDAECQAIFSGICENFNAGKAISVTGDESEEEGEEEEETPKKKTPAKKVAPKPAAKKATKGKKTEPTEEADEGAAALDRLKNAKPSPKKKGDAKAAPAPAAKPVKKQPLTGGSPKARKKLGALSCVDAAYALLKEEKVIMTAGEIIDLLAKRKIWKSNAATPAATLASKMIMECINKGEASRFQRPDRGLFKAKGVKCESRKAEVKQPPKKKVAVKTASVAAPTKKTAPKPAAKKAVAKKK